MSDTRVRDDIRPHAPMSAAQRQVLALAALTWVTLVAAIVFAAWGVLSFDVEYVTRTWLVRPTLAAFFLVAGATCAICATVRSAASTPADTRR